METALGTPRRQWVLIAPSLPDPQADWKHRGDFPKAESRFGLTFKILDREYISQVRRERGYGVNPWGTHTRFLVSQRLLIDEGYTGPLLDWLGEFRSGTLLILDEAHHAAPPHPRGDMVESAYRKRRVEECAEERSG